MLLDKYDLICSKHKIALILLVSHISTVMLRNQQSIVQLMLLITQTNTEGTTFRSTLFDYQYNCQTLSEVTEWSDSLTTQFDYV